MKPALLVKQSENGITCLLCAHRCTLQEGRSGICNVRKNVGGQIQALTYHRVAATHSDPIEKKPLYHFLPGSTSFSIAAMGCNFSCTFCQNHSLSMVKNEAGIIGEAVTPAQIVQAAQRNQSASISYTYTEPTIYFELMYETAQLAHAAGIKNVMVTNGYMSAEALEMIGPYLDAANIDLKAFRDDFYKTYCGARLQPVLDTIRAMRARGIWVELTTLLIPGLNDEQKEVLELINFIAQTDKNMPWHVSRFYPQHKLTNISPTDPQVMFAFLEEAAAAGLKYLYAGNVHSDSWSDTLCPKCKTLLIERSGYFTRVLEMQNGCCTNCDCRIDGVW